MYKIWIVYVLLLGVLMDIEAQAEHDKLNRENDFRKALKEIAGLNDSNPVLSKITIKSNLRQFESYNFSNLKDRNPIEENRYFKTNEQIGLDVQKTDDLAIRGSSENFVGVAGFSNTSAGMEGSSVTSIGVNALSTEFYGLNAESVNGIGARGISDNNIGVAGVSTISFGVFGLSTDLTGVGGASTNGPGLQGESNTFYGVYGDSYSEDSFDFFANAMDGSTPYGQSSSIRWKTNIRNIPEPLEKMNALRGVYFNWKPEYGGRHAIGFIAEEVGKILPEIVVYEKNGVDATGLDYSKLTPLLVEAANAMRAEYQLKYNEQQNRIDVQQKELNALKKQLEDLRAMVDLLAKSNHQISSRE